MARIANLKIRKLQDGRFIIEEPTELHNGKRHQSTFSSKAKAEKRLADLKAMKSNFGGSLATMSPTRISEAVEAFKKLDKSGLQVSLLSVIDQYLADHDCRNQSITLETLFEQYIASKTTKEKRAKELRQTKNRFANKAIMVSDLGVQHVETALAGLTNGAKAAHLRKMITVLNYGVIKKHLSSNPALMVDKPETNDFDVTVTNVETVSALFADAWQNDFDMIPFLVFSFFCGIRPGGEMNRLKWSDVTGNEVVLAKGQTKTGMKRAIPLCDAAKAYLQAYFAVRGVQTGKVVQPQLEKRRKRNWASVGHSKIPQDIARHTFCSMHLMEYGDLTKSLLASGHTRPNIFWQHYYAHTSIEGTRIDAEEAHRFYALRPPAGQPANVIAMTEAA